MYVPSFTFIKHPAIAGSALIQSTQLLYNVYRAYKFEDVNAMGNIINKHQLQNACAIH